MLAFLLLFIPFLLGLYCAYKKDGRNVLVISIGTVVAVLLCTIKSMFFFSHRVVPYSFGMNLYYHFIQGILPLVLLIIIYFLLTKGNFDEKVEFVFPLIASFFMVYLPYFAMNSVESSVYSSYVLFIRPIIYGSLLIYVSYCLNYINKFLKNKLIVVAMVILLIVCLALPVVFDSLYDIGKSVNLVYIFAIIYSVIPIAYSVFLFLKKND